MSIIFVEFIFAFLHFCIFCRSSLKWNFLLDHNMYASYV